MYLERELEYEGQPPDESWNAVEVFKKKRNFPGSTNSLRHMGARHIIVGYQWISQATAIASAQLMDNAGEAG
jgi:hypothetical protein